MCLLCLPRAERVIVCSPRAGCVIVFPTSAGFVIVCLLPDECVMIFHANVVCVSFVFAVRWVFDCVSGEHCVCDRVFAAW